MQVPSPTVGTIVANDKANDNLDKNFKNEVIVKATIRFICVSQQGITNH